MQATLIIFVLFALNIMQNFQQIQCATVGLFAPDRYEGVPDECLLPMDFGHCRAKVKRYYYDMRRMKCATFYWGGCAGNINNFKSLDDCNHVCMDAYNTNYQLNNENTNSNTNINNNKQNSNYKKNKYDDYNNVRATTTTIIQPTRDIDKNNKNINNRINVNGTLHTTSNYNYNSNSNTNNTIIGNAEPINYQANNDFNNNNKPYKYAFNRNNLKKSFNIRRDNVDVDEEVDEDYDN